MTKLLHNVQLFLAELEAINPKRESLEWYLINNLKLYVESLNTATTMNEIKLAAEKLDKFCIESMDWDTSLFMRCTKITSNTLHFVKNNR